MFWYVFLSIWKTSCIIVAEIYFAIGFGFSTDGVGVSVSVGIGVGIGVGVSVSIGVAFASCKALISYKFFYEYLLFKCSQRTIIITKLPITFVA